MLILLGCPRQLSMSGCSMQWNCLGCLAALSYCWASLAGLLCRLVLNGAGATNGQHRATACIMYQGISVLLVCIIIDPTQNSTSGILNQASTNHMVVLHILTLTVLHVHQLVACPCAIPCMHQI